MSIRETKNPDPQMAKLDTVVNTKIWPLQKIITSKIYHTKMFL